MAAEGGPPARQRWRSLRVRAVAVVLLVVIAPLLLVAVSSVFERDVGERMARRVEGASVAARGKLERALASAAGDAELARLVDESALSFGVRLRVVDPRGDVVVDADRESAGVSWLAALFFGPDGAPLLADADESLGELPARDEVRGAPDVGCRALAAGKLLVCHATAAVDARDGRWVVYAQESSRRAIRALYDLRYQLAKLTLLILPAALLLAWWLGWRMVRPVEKLRRQALEQLASAVPAVRLELSRGDEFGELAHAFNALAAKLEERSRATESFVADLAHELKNPVAAVRAAAEALDDGPVDAARAQRLGRALLGSSKALDALVTQLLELARAEAGLTAEPREMVDVAAVVRGVVDACASEERHPGVALTALAEGSARVFAVEHRLVSAVRNLVDNAASFAGPGGRATASVARRDGFVIVEVTDSGPGIAPEHLPRVFERFFTTRGERRGTGLGLALVRAVVEAHGGRAEAESRPGQGATFRLWLPEA